MQIKIDKADQIFSLYMRAKIPYCELCKKQNGLQVSHFWGRRHENTRFSEDNVDVLCFFCHQQFHENPAFYSEWKQKKLGEKNYKLLTLAANTYCRRDRKKVYVVYKNLYDALCSAKSF